MKPIPTDALLYAHDLKDGIADVKVIGDGKKILILFAALSSGVADAMLKSGIAPEMVEEALRCAILSGLEAAADTNKRHMQCP